MLKRSDLKTAIRRRYEDPAEVLQYSAIAAEGLAPFEVALIRQSFVPGQLVLDVGCGGGREAVPMAQCGLRVIGMDLIPAMVEATQRHGAEKGHRISCLAGDVSALPFCEASFDGVAMLGQVIAHVPGREKRVDVLRSVWRTLRPGGRLAMTTHNRRCHWKFQLYFAWVNRMRRLARRLGCGSGLGDNDRWSARISLARLQQPVFFHMYDFDEAVADLRSAGFEILDAGARAELEAGRTDSAMRAHDYLLGFIASRPGR